MPRFSSNSMMAKVTSQGPAGARPMTTGKVQALEPKWTRPSSSGAASGSTATGATLDSDSSKTATWNSNSASKDSFVKWLPSRLGAGFASSSAPAKPSHKPKQPRPKIKGLCAGRPHEHAARTVPGVFKQRKALNVECDHYAHK